MLPASLAPEKAVLSVALPFRRGAAAAGLPQRVKILGWGENIGRTTGARILVDDAVVASLTANQELVACDLVPLDYEHQSEPSHPNYIPDPRLSPGAGKIEVVSGEGVFLSAITYTANGEQYADSYQDVSAVVRLDKAGRPLWISSVALTQRGDLAGMELAESIAALSAATPSQAPTTMTDTTAAFREIARKFLKLPDTASDEDIIAAGDASNTEATDPMPAAETAALSARLATLEAIHTTQTRQALVDAATRDGKVIPLSAELIATTPLAVLSAMVEALPAHVVPMTPTGAKELPSEKTAALSADEKGAAARLGLTEAEYAKGKL